MWRIPHRFPSGLVRCISTAPPVLAQVNGKLVLGCGSNVADHIYNVKVVPRAGEKGFFMSPFKALEKRLIGGVTLNHLCWAALAEVPSGLLALQGQDEIGHFIRTNLKKWGVSTKFIKVDSQFSTAQCHVFIQEDGERSIVMAPAATSLINTQAVRKYFDEAIQQHASMVTTEISQVPLSGVLALLQSAKKANVLSVLDVDVPPSVAINEASLGSMEEVIECVKNADILKPSKSAADELLAVLGSGNTNKHSLLEAATELVRLCGSKLVAVTNGAQPSILASGEQVVEVAPPVVDKVVDATGAGDAFLGGLVAAITKDRLPSTVEELRNLGMVANAFGATCVQSVGGVPTGSSSEILQKYLSDVKLHIGMAASTDSSLQGFTSSLQNDLAAAAISQEVDHKMVTTFVDVLEQCQGQLLVSGVGKSGHVAQRFASSLSSVGIQANFVNAGEWIHGDLGKARAGRDTVIFLSNSGNTEECVTAALHLVQHGITTLAMTGSEDSNLSKISVASINYPSEELKEPFGCVPTSSLIVQEMMCNAILTELIQRKGIDQDTFKLNHPGGALGLKLKNGH